MNYTNGIGSLQQFHNASEAVASPSTGNVAKASSSSQSVSAQNASTNSAPVDKTNLSSTAGLVATALAGSDVRTDKVAALQQSITAGTYSVSSSDVAAKVINALLK